MPLKSFRFEQNKFGEKILEDLGSLFNLMSKKDHKQLLIYLNSPFFKVDQHCVELYEYLLPFHKRGTLSTNAETILDLWNQKYVEAKYGISYLIKKTKHLYQHFLGFLAHQKLRDDKKTKLQVLQRRLRNQGVPKPFESVSQQLFMHISDLPSGIDKFFDEFQLCHLTYFEQDMDHEQKGRTFFKILKGKQIRLCQTIDAAYACEENNLSKAASQKKNAKIPTFFSENKNEIDLKKLYELNLAVDHKNDGFSLNNLGEFSNVFLDKDHQISKEDRLILCKYVSNSISRGRNNSAVDLSRKSYEWLKRRIEWALLPLSKIGNNEYLNVVNTALLNNDLVFAESYIEKYTPLLPDKDEDKAYHLALAYCSFHNKDFDGTLKLLKKYFPLHFDPQYYSITLRVKSLGIKVHAEKMFLNEDFENQLDLFNNATKAFHKYLHRGHKKTVVPKLYVERYDNFLMLAKRLVVIPYSILGRKERAEKAEELLTLLNQSKPIVASNWFKKKIRANLKQE